MKKLLKFYLVTILFFPIICNGQGELNINAFVPSLIPPSPNAYALGKYGQIPVGLYTGSVNFDLPLYTFKTNHLSIPISLQYNSNGIKVDQVESSVGLGWNLNANGVVTKIVRNKPDDGGMCMYPDQEIFNVYNQAAIDFFNSVGNDNGDAEPDLFMFNFMGHYGKFIYDKDHKVVLMPFQDLKIESGVTDEDGFTITCSDGVKYYFDTLEEGHSTLEGGGHQEPIFFINGWYLTKIIHPYGDTVKFAYAENRYNYSTSVGQTYTVLDPPVQSVCGSSVSGDPGKNGPFYHNSTIFGKRLIKISSNNEEDGEVDINSDFNHPDISGFPLITRISVKDRYQEETERFDFKYGSYQPNNRVFLDTVRFKDPSKYYHFDYIKPDSLPKRLNFGQDHWGFYNGVTNNPNFYPEIPDNIYFSDIDGANKEPNGAFSNFGLLQKITYPTKGYSELFYEPNDYYVENPHILTPSIRFKLTP